MNLTTEKKQIFVVSGLILMAAFSRLIPHPFNFTAIGALALFSGAQLADKRLAYILPFSALLLSDLIIGFHSTILPVYLCFACTVWLGTRLQSNNSIVGTAAFSFTGSVVFFLVTNLPIWYGGFYPMTVSGTLVSYTAALPFFANQVVGDLVYTSLLFGVFSFLKRGYLAKLA